MRKSIRIARSGRRRGIILAVTLFLVMLATIASAIMVRTIIDQQNINKRRREVNRAYYDAEAGVSLVQDWTNNASHYAPSPTLFTYVKTDGTLAHDFAAFTAYLNANNGHMVIDQTTLATMAVDKLITASGVVDGTVKSIDIWRFGAAGAPALPAGSPLNGANPPELVVKSVGRSNITGLERTVVAWLDMSPFTKLQPLLGALLSQGQAGMGGNARIHWGQAWSKNQFSMLNNSQMNYIAIGDSNYDQWAKYRTESTIQFPNNWKFNPTGGVKPDWLFSQTSNNSGISSQSFPGLDPTNANNGNYRSAFEQNIPAGTLQWPNWGSAYTAFKNYAIAHGRYYTTNAGGAVLKNGVPVVWGTEFGNVNRDTQLAWDFIFIDTINGQPPAANGPNLATISIPGADAAAGIKGIFYVCANFSANGTGAPPADTTAQPPPTPPATTQAGVPNQTLDKIFLDGVLYTAGTAALGGNNGVYGCVIADKGFVGGGTPDIWYNWKLKDGLDLSPGNLGSILKIVLETNYSEGQTPNHPGA